MRNLPAFLLPHNLTRTPTSKMYPHRKYIYDIFLLFAKPEGGVKEWFEYVDDNVHWTVTGQHRFAGTWTNKEAYYNASWAKVNALLQDPGYRFEIPGGEEGIIVGQDGWSTVEMKTIDVKTKSGVPYDQHYSWHCRWSKEGKIVELRAFLDSDLLLRVLGGEQEKLGL